MSLQVTFTVILAAFVVVILLVGLTANRRIQGAEDYSVASRKMGAGLGAMTFTATYVSALTVIGLVGAASTMGLALVSYTYIGLGVGLLMLVLVAGRLHEAAKTSQSVAELLDKRYGGAKLVRAGAALTTVIGYFVYLVAQLFAVGILLSATLDFPVWSVVLVVGAIFVLYTLLGGLYAVARTDAVQLVMLLVGVFLALALVLERIGSEPDLRWSDGPGLSAFLGGPASSWPLALGWILSWALGVSCQPNYMQRIFATPDASTARSMLGWGSAICFWLANLPVLIIGIGIAIIMPGTTGDQALPSFLLSEGGSVIAAVALLGLVSAVMSTTDSLLHVLGVYFAQDIYCPLKGITDGGSKLKISRVATGAIGAMAVLTATYMSFSPLPLILKFASYAVGILGAGLFVPLYGGLLWRRATRQGALLAMITGVAVFAVGESLRSNGSTTVHGIVPAIAASVLAMVVGSFLTHRIESAEVTTEVATRSSTKTAPGDTRG